MSSFTPEENASPFPFKHKLLINHQGRVVPHDLDPLLPWQTVDRPSLMDFLFRLSQFILNSKVPQLCHAKKWGFSTSPAPSPISQEVPCALEYRCSIYSWAFSSHFSSISWVSILTTDHDKKMLHRPKLIAKLIYVHAHSYLDDNLTGTACPVSKTKAMTFPIGQ